MRPSAAFCRLLEEVGRASGLEETCSTLDRRLHELLPFHAMAVFLPSDGSLRPVYTSPGMLLPAGSPGPAAGGDNAVPVDATRRPAFPGEPQPAPAEPAAVESYGSMLAVPLDDGAEVVGVLSLYNQEQNLFSAQDLGVLLWIREDLARALRHALGAVPAPPVPLEPCPDWPTVLHLLRAEIGRGAPETLWVLLCHLERLAAIGTRFGEFARARLLQAVVAGLRRSCRGQDNVTREGDDFILTLHDLEEPAVETKKTSVAALVEGISLAHFGDRLVPVLAGAARFPHDAGEPGQLLALAAQRLRPVSIPAASFAEDLVHLAAALEAGARRPEANASEPVPVFVRAALEPVQIHAPLSG
jgi:GGDEF domain-containing protein